MSQHKKSFGPDRHHGGPGSSHQDADDQPVREAREDKPIPGEPTNRERSRVSGGGGEQDRHHSHDPKLK